MSSLPKKMPCVPDGWEVTTHGDQYLIIRGPAGFVTVSLVARVFRLGHTATHGPAHPRSRPAFGRGWMQKVVDDAVRALKGLEASRD